MAEGPLDPTGGEGSGGELDPEAGEHRLLPTLAVVVLIVLPFLLPIHIGRIAHVVLGGAEAVLVVAMIVVDPGRINRRGALARGLSISLTGLLVVAAGIATGVLVADLIGGGSQFTTPKSLLATGALVWVDTSLTFALLYWELDGGGPAQRLHHMRAYPDLAFPQQLNPDLAPPGWRPTFIDYLYLGLTNALAFSPTDVMPLARWAKVTMAVQSVISLVILSLVIANAVNLLQ